MQLRQTEPQICFQMDQQRVIEQIRHNKLESALWLYGYLREWNKVPFCLFQQVHSKRVDICSMIVKPRILTFGRDFNIT